MHPLDGAYLRIDRASEHLEDFKLRAKAFSDAHLNNLSIDFNSKTNLAEIYWAQGFDPPPIMSIVLGEIIYNLRAALDYMVYELSAYDTPPGHDLTQFPIESKPEMFWGRRRNTYLLGINAAHVKAIELLQPYKGCDWTATLAAISNPDKHRKLTDSRGEVDIPIKVEYRDSAPLNFLGRPGKVFKAQGRLRGTVQDVYVETRATIDVTFSDKTPVIPTIDSLKVKVAETLDAFKPEFK